MKNIIYILFISSSIAIGQTGLFVDGASVYTESNTLFYVEGDVDIDNAGTIENNGDIEFDQDWINNAGNTGLINNAFGTVHMIGGNQEIRGNSITQFYNLDLKGGFVLKEAYQNAFITNNLNLNNAELQTHQNTIHLTNPDPLSLQWLNGFISGDSIGGYFARSTDRTSVYQYPVGNTNLFTSPYRGIDITPANGDSNVYGVRLAAEDASLDVTGTSFTGAPGPYDRTLKDNTILQLNPVFYHHVARMHGTSIANVKFYFFENDHLSQNRRFDGLGQWKSSFNEWDFVTTDFTANISGPAGYGTPENFISLTTGNFDDDAFSLAVTEGLLVFVPQIFSPNGDGANDVVFVRGRKIKELKFVVYNRWGEKVFETTDKTIGWDGSFKGQEAQSSVYVYYLEAEIEDFGEYKQQGNITLVR